MTILQPLLAGDVPRRTHFVDGDGETIHEAAWFDSIPAETPQSDLVGRWVN